MVPWQNLPGSITRKNPYCAPTHHLVVWRSNSGSICPPAAEHHSHLLTPCKPRIRHRCAAAGSRRARRQASANASRAGAVGGRPSGDRGRRPRSKAPVHLHIDERLGRRADDTGRGVLRGRDDRARRFVQGVRQRGVGPGCWPAQDEPAVPQQDGSHLPDQPPERQRRGGRGVHGADAQLGVRPPLGAQLCQGDHEVAEGFGERRPAAAG